MLQVYTVTFNPFLENTYIVYDEKSRSCAIIDPGFYERAEEAFISKFLKEKDLRVDHLINTHAHIDHVLGNQYIKTCYDAKLALHPEELPILEETSDKALFSGFIAYYQADADIMLKEGDRLQVGDASLQVLHVPGHTPGHIALYEEESKSCFAGDVLFRGRISRTDLPGGDYARLLKSIYEQLFSLDDEVTIYPGHGPTTTVGVERDTNPLLEQKTRFVPPRKPYSASANAQAILKAIEAL